MHGLSEGGVVGLLTSEHTATTPDPGDGAGETVCAVGCHGGLGHFQRLFVIPALASPFQNPHIISEGVFCVPDRAS